MSLPYFPMYPRDFYEGTQRMTLEQKGAYIMVLNLIYTRNGPVDDEDGYLARYVGCSIRKWQKLRLELIGLGKIEVVDGFIRNSRADEELLKRSSYVDQKRENRSRPNKNKAEESRPKTTRAKSEPEPDTDRDDLIPARGFDFGSVDGNDLDQLEAACRKWANGALAPTAGPLILAPITRLLRPHSGPSCTMEDVRTGIMRAAESAHRRGEKVGIAYFCKPILQARDERLRPTPQPENHDERPGQGQCGTNSYGRRGDRPRPRNQHGASAFGVAYERMFGGDPAPADVCYEPIDGRSQRVA